jgi:hypothetical protein
MATTIKRVREEGDHGDHVSKKPLSGELIYIMKNKLTSKRFDHLNSLAIKNGLTITNSYSDKVTHIVTNVPTINRVEDILNTYVVMLLLLFLLLLLLSFVIIVIVIVVIVIIVFVIIVVIVIVVVVVIVIVVIVVVVIVVISDLFPIMLR